MTYNKNRIQTEPSVRDQESMHYVRYARTKPSPGSNPLALLYSTIVYADQ